MRTLLACTIAWAWPQGPTPAAAEGLTEGPASAQLASLSAEPGALASPDTLLYVEAPGLCALLERGLADPLILALRRHEFVEAALRRLETAPEAALAGASLYLGRPVLPALASGCAGGLSLSVELRAGQPVWTLVMQAKDEATRRALMEDAFGLIAKRGGWPLEALRRPLATEAGVELWQVGDELALAARGATVLAAQDLDTLRAALERAAPESDSLARRADFQSARAQQGRDQLLWAWVDGQRLRAQPGTAQRLERFRRAPSVAFLLGSSITDFASSVVVCAGLRWSAEGLELSLHARGGDDALGDLVPARAARAASAPAMLQGELARASVYRSLDGILARRSELFPVQSLPRFAEALSNLALLFGGVDVSDEILPQLMPWMTLFVAEADFDAGATPDTRLPAAALVAQLAEPQRIGPRLVAAFQTAVGLANVERAQQMMPPMILGLYSSGTTLITKASFLAPRPGEGVDLRYNLVPACALVGDRFVIGTHASLVEQLVRRIEAGELSLAVAAGESLELVGAALARTIEDNRDALVMQAVLDEGKTEEKARADVSALAGIARLVERLGLRLDRPSPEETRLELSLRLAEARR